MKKIIKFITPLIALTAVLSSSLIMTGCTSDDTTEEPSTETERTISSISVNTQPNKTIYYVGETFDVTGLVISVNYSNGTSSLVAGRLCEFSPSNPLMLTDDTIIITYEEFSTTVGITVCELASISLTVDEDALETSYNASETYDFSSALTLSGTYTDINSEIVTTDIITDYSLVFKLKESDDVEDLVCDVNNVSGFELANSTYTVYAKKDYLISKESFEIEVVYDA